MLNKNGLINECTQKVNNVTNGENKDTTRQKIIAKNSPCVGCGLCSAVCPVSAIKFSLNEGHWRPCVKADCIDCGICESKCPANNTLNLKKLDYNIDLPCYAAWAKDSNYQKVCSSGGVATLLSENMIDNGGMVAGVWYNPNTHIVEHRICRTRDELVTITGSKYVLSNKYNLYRELSNMKEHEKILFIGVPCEIRAFKEYCATKNFEAFFVDLLCRGGGSPAFFKQHLKSIGVTDEDVRFRGGAVDDTFSVSRKGKLTYINKQLVDPYFSSYMRHSILQDKCFKCDYAGRERLGDITLGDFMVLDVDTQNKANNQRISLVIINNEKGKQFYANIKDKVESYQRPFSEAVEGNWVLREPTYKKWETDLLRSEVKKCGWIQAYEKIYKKSYNELIRNGKRNIRLFFVKKSIKNQIKMVLRKCGVRI